jgi:hypothetical protein
MLWFLHLGHEMVVAEVPPAVVAMAVLEHDEVLRDERLEMDALNPKGPEDRQEEQDDESFLKGENPAPATGGHHHH